MDINKNSYYDFLDQVGANIKNDPDIPKKVKKLLNKIKRKVKGFDDEVFTYISDINISYIVNIVESGGEYPLLNVLKEALNQDDDDDDDENGSMPINFTPHPFMKKKRKLEIIKDSKLMLSEDIMLPNELENAQLILDIPMEMTFTSDGNVWVNHSLWKYLSDMIKSRIIPPFNQYVSQNYIGDESPTELDYMDIELAKKDKRIIITLSTGPSRAMKIRLNKHTDDYGRIYGTTDSGSAFQLSIQSSFSLKGKYTIYPTNFYGIVVGEKISPKTNVTHEEVK